MSAARRSQAERRATTRAALIAAARRVFAEHGYEAASVQRIARDAGVSTGALYVHFAGKHELFLALLDEGIPHWSAGYLGDQTNPRSVEDVIDTAVDRWSRLLDEQPETTRLFFEFWSAACRDPDLGQQFAARHRAIRDAMAALIAAVAADLDEPIPSELDTLAAAITALADGFAQQRLVDPSAGSKTAFRWALLQLLRPTPPH